MRVVAVLAVGGLVALVLALLTDSTWAAGGVIALALAGIVVLLRDWRGERTRTVGSGESAPNQELEVGKFEAPLTADDFSPDLSADPDGPSSDARAD